MPSPQPPYVATLVNNLANHLHRTLPTALAKRLSEKADAIDTAERSSQHPRRILLKIIGTLSSCPGNTEVGQAYSRILDRIDKNSGEGRRLTGALQAGDVNDFVTFFETLLRRRQAFGQIDSLKTVYEQYSVVIIDQGARQGAVQCLQTPEDQYLDAQGQVIASNETTNNLGTVAQVLAGHGVDYANVQTAFTVWMTGHISLSGDDNITHIKTALFSQMSNAISELIAPETVITTYRDEALCRQAYAVELLIRGACYGEAVDRKLTTQLEFFTAKLNFDQFSEQDQSALNQALALRRCITHRQIIENIEKPADPLIPFSQLSDDLKQQIRHPHALVEQIPALEKALLDKMRAAEQPAGYARLNDDQLLDLAPLNAANPRLVSSALLSSEYAGKLADIARVGIKTLSQTTYDTYRQTNPIRDQLERVCLSLPLPLCRSLNELSHGERSATNASLVSLGLVIPMAIATTLAVISLLTNPIGWALGGAAIVLFVATNLYAALTPLDENNFLGSSPEDLSDAKRKALTVLLKEQRDDHPRWQFFTKRPAFILEARAVFSTGVAPLNPNH